MLHQSTIEGFDQSNGETNEVRLAGWWHPQRAEKVCLSRQAAPGCWSIITMWLLLCKANSQALGSSLEKRRDKVYLSLLLSLPMRLGSKLPCVDQGWGRWRNLPNQVRSASPKPDTGRPSAPFHNVPVHQKCHAMQQSVYHLHSMQDIRWI